MEGIITKTKVVLLMCWMPCAVAFSQTSGRQSEQQREQIDRLKLPSSASSMMRPILDAPLDPSKYFIGPSDVFAVSIWANEPLYLSLTVSPEGILVIPTVGEVYVANLTLADARKKILAEIKKKYISGEPTVTLLQPREIYVSVSGHVKQPSRYEVSATERVEKALLDANRTRISTTDMVRPTLEIIDWPQDASKRNISVRRRDGTVIHVDLQKFHATGDDRWNPYMREGDEIYVPRADMAKNFIGVYGGVNEPGPIEFVEGDNISDAVKLAGGLTKRAMADSVVLARFGSPSSTQTIVDLNMPGHAATPLRSGDRIVVKEKFEFLEDFTVKVEGEAQYPGVYPITKDNTRLSEILKHAGFTPFASLKSAELIRSPLGEPDPVIERLLRNRGNVNPEDEEYLAQEVELRLKGERVNVDFVKLVEGKNIAQDVLLQPNDRILIPSSQKAVYVFGQVANPSQIAYLAGKTLSYYVFEAGGFTDHAHTSGVRVIKNNTRQWVDPGDTEIEEGDLIWVPKEPYRPFSYYLGVISQTASIITGALTIVLLVLQLR